MLINLLNNLIEKKFYENKEEIQNKLNVFFAMNVISEEEYSNLILKTEEMYKTEEINIEKIAEENTESEVQE